MNLQILSTEYCIVWKSCRWIKNSCFWHRAYLWWKTFAYLPTTPLKGVSPFSEFLRYKKTFFENSDDVHLITKVHIFVELIARKSFQHLTLMFYYTHVALLYLFNCLNPSIFHKKILKLLLYGRSGIWRAMAYTPISGFPMLAGRYTFVPVKYVTHVHACRCTWKF